MPYVIKRKESNMKGYIQEIMLLRRGWTRTTIRKWLGSPDLSIPRGKQNTSTDLVADDHISATTKRHVADDHTSATNVIYIADYHTSATTKRHVADDHTSDTNERHVADDHTSDTNTPKQRIRHYYRTGRVNVVLNDPAFRVYWKVMKERRAIAKVREQAKKKNK